MIRNYIRIAIRKISRNRSYTVINITGLSVGIASCLLIFLIVQFQLSFDNSHSKKGRIYRLVTVSQSSEGSSYTQGVPFPVADGLRSEYPQLGKTASIYNDGGALIYILNNNRVEKKFKEEKGVYFVEPQFFDIFDLKWLAGNPKTALSGPNDMVLSRETAARYFGSWKSALGKYIKYNNDHIYKISGILEDVPDNNSYQIKVALSFESYKESNLSNFEDWVSTYSTYNCLVLLPGNMQAAQLNNFANELIKKHIPKEYNSKDVIISQPLSEMHFDSRFNGSAFSKELITALSLIAGFLLLIACVNFINLATAQSVNRSREIGVRKVLGSNKQQIITQFLGETAIITISAVLAGIVLAEISLPFINNLLQLNLDINFLNNPSLIVFLATVSILVIFLSGSYPALMLSGINPVLAFKNKFSKSNKSGLTMRRGLVILQFVIAQVLVIGMLVVVSQMEFFRSTPYGFNKDAVILVPIPSDSISLKLIDVLKNRLLQQTGISKVSFSCFSPSDNSHWSSDFKFDGSPQHSNFEADLKWADADYFSTYDIKFVAGRPYILSDSINGLVVNESFAKKFGYSNPQDILGKKVNFFHDAISAPIVGVVNDFHNRPLGGKINPIVMGSWKGVYQLINIKIRPSQVNQTLASIEKLWNETYPDYVYEYQFLDQKIDDFYKKEDRLSQLYKVFAGIAIFISCLGLYGLVSFMAVQRTKEVGIRKVLGASIPHIIYLFSKEFTILILIAFLISAPVAYYFMHQWLENFAYRINLGVGLFALSFLISIAVAWLTVGYRAIKSATANPVKSLKYE